MKLSLRWSNNLTAYGFLLPFLVPFAVFVFYPVFRAIYISFFDYTPYGVNWNGIGNYRTLMQDAVFLTSLWNTIRIVMIVVPTSMAVALLISVIIVGRSAFTQSFFRASFYLPVVASAVASSLIWRYIYEENYGFANHVLSLLGIPPVSWLSSAGMALGSLSTTVIFSSIGVPVILYTASLAAIPRTYYEACEIDGATSWGKFIHITLPLLKPTLLYLAVTGTIGAFQIFTVVMLLTGGGPNYATTTIAYLLYKTAFAYSNFGLASAIGIVLLLIIGVISFVQFKYFSTDVEY